MNVNILLFDGFESLDAFGPIEVFGKVEEFSLRYISIEGGVVTSKQGVKIVTENASVVDGILVIPGGQGTRALVNDENFIKALREFGSRAVYCLSVCTGAALLAKTDLLDGKSATTNKKSFEWVRAQNANIHWKQRARWVNDGKFYTSSGVSAGIDMALGFVADLFGFERARDIARHIEYNWNEDKDTDPFCVVK